MIFLEKILDGLDEPTREIFLHIACFFQGEDKDRVITILDHPGLYVHVGLQTLINKSLLEVTLENRLCMYNLLQQTGREIVYEECIHELEKRSRLWMQEDINYVLTKNMVRGYVGILSQA